MRSLAWARRGIVAVEVALIGPVFLYFLFGTLEIAVMLYASTVVDGAAQSAARKIRTGEAQNSGNTSATFQTELCSGLVGAFPCNDITLDVKTFASFSAVTIPALRINGNGDLVYDDGDNDDSNDVLYTTEFSPGGASQINVVRVLYSWNFTTPLIGNMVGGDDGTLLLSSTHVFRNEPYQ